MPGRKQLIFKYRFDSRHTKGKRMTASEFLSGLNDKGRLLSWWFYVLVVFALGLIDLQPAYALKMMEKERIFFYFPKSESDLAQHLMAMSGEMRAARSAPPSLILISKVA